MIDKSFYYLLEGISALKTEGFTVESEEKKFDHSCECRRGWWKEIAKRECKQLTYFYKDGRVFYEVKSRM